jgi:hypothetical protein
MRLLPGLEETVPQIVVLGDPFPANGAAVGMVPQRRWIPPRNQILAFAKYWLLPNIGCCQILAFAKYWLLPNIGLSSHVDITLTSC